MFASDFYFNDRQTIAALDRNFVSCAGILCGGSDGEQRAPEADEKGC